MNLSEFPENFNPPAKAGPRFIQGGNEVIDTTKPSLDNYRKALTAIRAREGELDLKKFGDMSHQEIVDYAKNLESTLPSKLKVRYSKGKFINTETGEELPFKSNEITSHSLEPEPTLSPRFKGAFKNKTNTRVNKFYKNSGIPNP